MRVGEQVEERKEDEEENFFRLKLFFLSLFLFSIALSYTLPLSLSLLHCITIHSFSLSLSLLHCIIILSFSLFFSLPLHYHTLFLSLSLLNCITKYGDFNMICKTVALFFQQKSINPFLFIGWNDKIFTLEKTTWFHFCLMKTSFIFLLLTIY